MSEHSPLPWREVSRTVFAGEEQVAFMVEGDQKANSAFIVEACNNYEEVKARLDRAGKEIYELKCLCIQLNDEAAKHLGTIENRDVEILELRAQRDKLEKQRNELFVSEFVLAGALENLIKKGFGSQAEWDARTLLDKIRKDKIRKGN